MHGIDYKDVKGELESLGYTVDGVLGEGCFGVVHRVTDKDGNVRAMKTVKAQRGGDYKRRPKGTRRRLCEITMDEVAVAKALAARLTLNPARYEGVVGMYGTLVTERYHHVIMECLVGSNLTAYMKAHYPDGMPLPALRHLAWSMLRGLQVIHSVGALHRDIKPDNVFVEHGSDGDPIGFKLIDVGLGRVVCPLLLLPPPSPPPPPGDCDGGDDDLMGAGRLTGSCVGSRLFRSPALDRGERYGVECDVWGVGYVLYFAATGKYLTSTDESRYKAEKLSVWENCAKYSYSFPHTVSDDLKPLLRGMLSKMPQSVSELLSDCWFCSFRS